MTYLTRCALAEIEEENATIAHFEEEEIEALAVQIYAELLAEHEAANFYDLDDEEADWCSLAPRAHALAVARYMA